jgi:ferritin
MLSSTMQEALNKQLNAELYASNFYLSLSSYLDGRDLSGMARWMRSQAHEERDHMLKFYHFIIDRDGRALVSSVPPPPNNWTSTHNAFSAALQREVTGSKLINALVDLSAKEDDRATYNFLQDFVACQAREEAELREILGRLELVGDSGQGLLMLDQELGDKA